MGEKVEKEFRVQCRERFLALLEWEKKRSDQCEKFRNVVSTLVCRIFKKLEINHETNIAILRFVKNKSIGFQQYSESLKSEIKYLPEPSQNSQSFKLSTGLSFISFYQSSLAEILSEVSRKIE